MEFPSQIDGFSQIEYFVILLSFIYGFGIADLFENLAGMFRRKAFYLEVALWSTVLFMGVSFLWILIWLRLEHVSENAFIYFLLFIPGLLIFLSLAFLYPSKGDYNKVKKHFLENYKKFFLMLLILEGILIVAPILLDLETHIMIIGLRTVSLIMLFLLIFINRKWLRNLIATIQIIWRPYLYIWISHQF
jgi:hypothetical protein